MIKALCASLLFSATSSLILVSESHSFAQPGTVGYDLNVVIDGKDYTRYFYNEECYFKATQYTGQFSESLPCSFSSPNFFNPDFGVSSAFKFYNFGYFGDYDSWFNDDHLIYAYLGSEFYFDEVMYGSDSSTNWGFTAWVDNPADTNVYYFEWYTDFFIGETFSHFYQVRVSDFSLVAYTEDINVFAVQVAEDFAFHFDPLPSEFYSPLVSSEHPPVFPRTQPKLPPQSVTDKDFNLWNTVRDFYVRFLFGGTDSQGTVYNKASFGSVPTSSFDVDVGGNSVSVGDWLSSTLTIITFALFVLVIVLVIRWIAVCIGNAVLGVSGR